MESPDIFSDEWIVQFGYEWFADYLIAEHIIESCGDAAGVTAALAGGDPSSGEYAWEAWNAPLEALGVLLPERIGVELPEVLAMTDAEPIVVQAFLAGLPRRAPETIGPECRELVAELLESVRHQQTVAVFDAVVACSLVPHHPLGSAFLDQHLRRLEMPDRDAAWSKYLYKAYGGRWGDGSPPRLGREVPRSACRRSILSQRNRVRHRVGVVPNRVASFRSRPRNQGPDCAVEQPCRAHSRTGRTLR